MKIKLLKLIFNYLFFYFNLPVVITNNNDREGIQILPVNTSLACSGAQPLTVNQTYGYISTPNFDGFHHYPSHTECSWLLTAPEKHSILIRFKTFALDLKRRDGLYIYDGFDINATLIDRFSGFISRDNKTIISSKNAIFMRFVALSETSKSIGFWLFFERIPTHVDCETTEIKCRNGYQCVSQNQSCDGVDDCDDGTDEQNCTIKLSDLQFKQSCGRPRMQSLQGLVSIVGGTAAKPGSWPWMVDMRIASQEPDGHTCGATVLNRQWILTAGHCILFYPNATEWRIHFGKYEKLIRDPNEVMRYIDRIYVNPEFGGLKDSWPPNATWFDRVCNDLALIRLNAPLPLHNPFISAVCLPQMNDELTPNETVWVTGWGDTYGTGNDLVLKQTEVPVVPNEICRQWMPGHNVGPTQICAGFEKGGQDACQGDSGGPLVRLNGNSKTYEIMGIVSTGGAVCGGEREAGIYTKVSHYISWINSTIASNLNNSTLFSGIHS